jgi:hypothetical protein
LRVRSAAVISRQISSGFSLRGLSEVMTVQSESSSAAAAMSGRFARSRSPPHPKTVTIRAGASSRSVRSTFRSASSVCA